MDQLKFSLGPYELFSSILGGMPLLLAFCLLYNPVSSIQELVPVVQKNSSIAIALSLLFISYILGGTVQSLTWRYFKLLCTLLNEDYRYFGNLIHEKENWLLQQGAQVDKSSLDFDGRLVLRLQEKTGISQENKFIESRVAAYLREHNRQASLSAAELHLANHIMYRSWSFGFCLLSVVLLINLFRTPTHPFEQWILPLLSLGFAYLTFFRALHFKRWNNRELLLGFYFAAGNEKIQNLTQL
ncbi:MAG: hypothetical protein DCF15_02325 [Phormidesmis priestleyi]|uniref:Uncharacterized protein n=1 Tax=Phormidesmis priestleyi TaxID=268141 RepID=A0A2W4XX79_9CYAN|nr:MAG: hypothetical protein DCF15_02325 [Phormidesmis priestleyi]